MGLFTGLKDLRDEGDQTQISLDDDLDEANIKKSLGVLLPHFTVGLLSDSETSLDQLINDVGGL